MEQKDYVSRGHVAGARHKPSSRKKRGSTKVSKTVLALAAALLVIFICGLYFITQNKPNGVPLLPKPNNRLSNNLPPKPEERWRYIKELASRQIGVQTPTEPTASGEVNAKTPLTAEQRKLLEQMQADMQQPPTQLNEVPYNAPSQATAHGNSHQQQQVAPPHNLFNKGATSAPTQPPIEPKPAVKQNRFKQEAKTGSKQKWVVQCGSFRATDQAESVRVSLAFEGIESHITTDDGWNRVILGPYSSRETVDKTLARLHGVGMSSCIARAVGG
ncbi:cell division protein FtsN [Serratia symbiotica]|nr:cell division protein FtsN [Serratia symbiotica]